ncbi:hypothetical protein HJG60_008862 [Phyllostomus discolor]|uniref:Uncharacterized protein n=2 Tax=Phyllostomus discolor TaxID=89673 RepID=A0A833YWL5_9CHIR|nr:hypothetical protein HJG60_008862 [Phyllostomus discolor]
MGPRLLQGLLLAIFVVVFMDEGDRVLPTTWVRFCNKCSYFNGSHCTNHMKNCWKFNAMAGNRSSHTDHFYFTDRLTGMYLYRHSTLSGEPCEQGMVQVIHDVLRETFCCTHNDRCNNPDKTMDIVKEFVSLDQNRLT